MLPSGREHLRPELLDDGGRSRRPGGECFAGERVGVDHDRPVLGQQPRDLALAGPDAPGEADLDHDGTLAGRDACRGSARVLRMTRVR